MSVCQWDQRIPNNPIFNRSFLLAQPPIVLFERPVSTYGTKEAPVGQVHMETRMPQKEELRLANYWRLHTANKQPTGLLINPRVNNRGPFNRPVDPARLAGSSKFPGLEAMGPAPVLDQGNLTGLTGYKFQYPTQPWQQGVTYNINAENAIKPYQKNIYKDTISAEVEEDLTNQRTLTDARARARSQPVKANWDQPTSLKMTGPFATCI